MLVSTQQQIYHLPNEILDLISSELPDKDRVSTFPCVCKHWYQFALSDLRYNPIKLATEILNSYSGSLSKTELIKHGGEKKLIDFCNTLFNLKFGFQAPTNPKKYKIKFKTNPSQEFKIFEYDRSSKSPCYQFLYNPRANQFNLQKKPKSGFLQFSCYIHAHTSTITAEMDHRDTPEGAILLSSNSIDEKFVIKDKVYFTHSCSIKVEKLTKFHQWKVIKLPEQYKKLKPGKLEKRNQEIKRNIEIMQNINSCIHFHLTSFIEWIAHYNLQQLKDFTSISAFAEEKKFNCNSNGKIDDGVYKFTLYAKEVKWHNGKKIVTLCWNDPSYSFRSALGDIRCQLRLAVISRTTELMITKLGLLNFET